MKKRIIAILAAGALSLVLACGAGIGRAYAYFTSYVEARGMHPIHLGDWTEINEEYTHWHKDITLKNKDDSYDAVYVRAKVFVAAEYSLKFTKGSYWKGPDEWKAPNEYEYFYYQDGEGKDIVLEPGEITETLGVDIYGADGNEVIVNEDDAERTVNVVVVYETTPAIQSVDENGNIIYEPADWDRKATKTQTSEAEQVTTAAEGGDD